jgi:soluble lytic murein transglycosylase-like protein
MPQRSLIALRGALSLAMLISLASALRVPFSSTEPGGSSTTEAARAASPADDRAAAVRRQIEEQNAQLDAMIAYDRQLVADLERIAPLVPPQYRLLVIDAARHNGLDPHDLAAVGYTESRWDCTRVGTSGEIGSLQLLPSTAAEVAIRIGITEYDLRDPATNVALGAAYLRGLIAQQGSVDAALAAYNAGPQWAERAPRAARSYIDRVRAAQLQKGP